MKLELVEFLQGLFSLIYVIITLIMGLIFLSKFLKYKRRDLLLVGITWIGIAAPWMGDATNFILVIFYNTILSEMNYLIITIAFIPIGILCWLIVITNLMFKNMQKIILVVIVILSIIFEIIFFTLLFIDTSLVGKFLGPFQVEYSFIFQVYFMIYLALFVLPGILLARHSIRSDNLDIKLKGKLLLIAFILAIIGASLDSIIPLTALTVVITRIILSFGAILFYFGYSKKIEESEEKEIESVEEKDYIQDFLKMVSKHKYKKLTEEEILYHKEKRICLVCTGKISRRKKYVCPKCDILYCLRCSIALSSLENICWVCETPIDPSKPVGVSETTEEIVIDKKKLIKKKK